MQKLFHLNKISVAIQSSEKYILNFSHLNNICD